MFLYAAISLSFWVLADYLLYQKTLAPYQTFLNRLDLALATVAIVSTIHFITYFPAQIYKFSSYINRLVYALSIALIAIIMFTDKVVSFAYMEDYGSNFKQGPLFLVFAVIVTLFCLYLIVAMLVKYFKLKDIEKVQMKYFIWGIVIIVICNLLLNLLIPVITSDFRYSRFGASSLVVFIMLVAYSILRYKLFNLKVLLTEVAVTVLIVVSGVQIFQNKILADVIVKTLFFIIVVWGGRLLIASVDTEIRQKEELACLAKKLESANKHLKDLDKMKDDFLSMASHELNTPLAAIEGYLSMILEEGMGGGESLNPQTREYLNRVFKASERLAGIVKDLLNVSRIESGRIHLIYTEAQIEQIIKDAVNEIHPKIKEKKHTICVELPANPLPKSWMDVTRISEIVINLLGNAIKYTDDGGHIEIGAKESRDGLLVWVKDSGRGIPKNKATSVFQKFTQVDVLKDEVKGTGLGMYISQKFVELHKGKIWFESEGEGKGTTFFFSLPILKERPYDPNEGEGPVLR